MGAVIEFGILLALPLWLLRKRSEPPYPKSRSIGAMLKEFLIAIPTTIGVLICTAIIAFSAKVISTRLGHPAGSAFDYWEPRMERGPLRLLLLAVAVAPLVEEVYFRGFLYNSLRAICPGWIAVLLQALLFGLGHAYEPLGVIVTFVIGLLFAAIYEWRKTLLATVLVHGIYNLIVIGAIAAVVMANAYAPMIGVVFRPPANGPATVDNVLPDSPAEKADVRPGDLIVKYDGLDVNDGNQLIRLVRAGKVGDEVVLEVRRGGKRLRKHLVLRSRADVE